MTRVIQDLWILINDGIVLFNRVFNPKVETQLFGALLSALNSFAEEVSDGGLSSFELSNKKFTLMKKMTLLFVVNCSNKVKQKKMTIEMENISTKFINCYSEALFDTEWDGDISIFKSFEAQIESTLENPVEKFWQGF